MLKREKVDVLSICTQHTQHPAAVEIAAAAGMNAISEKPLAIDFVSCDHAIAVAQQQGSSWALSVNADGMNLCSG